MNIALCISWFMFGFIVGQILLIGIALMLHDKENKNGKNNNDKSKQ